MNDSEIVQHLKSIYSHYSDKYDFVNIVTSKFNFDIIMAETIYLLVKELKAKDET